MPRKRHKPEEIVAKLRQVDVLISQGQAVADATAIGEIRLAQRGCENALFDFDLKPDCDNERKGQRRLKEVGENKQQTHEQDDLADKYRVT